MAQVRTSSAPCPRTSALGAGGGVLALIALAHVADDALTGMLAAALPSVQSRHGLTGGR